MMDIAFYSEEAKQINTLIFETIYHASLEQSNEIAIERYNIITGVNFEDYPDLVSSKTNPTNDLKHITMDKLKDTLVLNCERYKLSDDHCGAYSSFEGSPASKGILQFDMWNVKPSGYDWEKLKILLKIWITKLITCSTYAYSKHIPNFRI